MSALVVIGDVVPSAVVVGLGLFTVQQWLNRPDPPAEPHVPADVDLPQLVGTVRAIEADRRIREPRPYAGGRVR